MYERQGRYADAEPLYQRSLRIRETKLGKDHPSVATTLNNLAELYRAQGRYADAEPLLRRSLAIDEIKLGKDHPSVATTLNNLAGLYKLQGRYTDAEAILKRSLGILQSKLGKDHPSVASSLNNLAGLYRAQRDWMRATEFYRRGAAVIARRTRRGPQIVGRGLTGKKKSEAVRSNHIFAGLVKSAYRLKQRNDTTSTTIGSETFQAAQWTAGSGAAASLAKMAERQATGDPKLAQLVRERQDLVDEWQKRDSVRSAAISQAPDERSSRKEARNFARLAAIDTRISEIDKRLAADFPDYATFAHPAPLNIADVQSQLKPNEALILFLDTEDLKPTSEETFIWVVTKTASKWVRSKFGTTALRDHVDALRCGLDFRGSWSISEGFSRCQELLKTIYTEEDQRNGKALPFDLKRAFQLYTELFGQVSDLIAGKELLIVPSGPLTQLPFQVLVTKKPNEDDLIRNAFTKASWLAKHHAITVLPAVSSLMALREHSKPSRATSPFIAFANPLLSGPYGTDKRAWERQSCPKTNSQPPEANSVVSVLGKLASLFRGELADPENIRRQYPLPETTDEVCAVARSLGLEDPDQATYLGDRAREAVLKARSADGTLARARVVHFATHGLISAEMEMLVENGIEPALMLTPPQMATREDDGLLTASEIAALKLDADWVILSACNTAAGESDEAEALSGLAKAFFYAGARSLLVSHWFVDSQATVTLITKTFDAMKRDPKIGRAEALRHAMLELIKSGKRTWHPAYWAPFVIVGEGAG